MEFYHNNSDVVDRQQTQRAPAPPGYFPGAELLGTGQPISPQPLNTPSPSDSDFQDDLDLDHSDTDRHVTASSSNTTYSTYQCDTGASLTGLVIPVLSNGRPWSSYNTRGAYSDHPVYDDAHGANHGAIHRSSSHRSATHDAADDTLPCSGCDKRFFGRYRNSNLRRHMRQTHSAPQKHLCTACSREFRRSDARLKHERNNHPELNRPVAQPRQHRPEKSDTSDNLSVVDSGKSLAYSDIETGTAAKFENTLFYIQSPNGISTALQALGDPPSHSAEAFFTELWERLDRRDYLRFCEGFFTQWANIIEDLRNQGSETYVAFTQAFDVLRKESQVNPADTLIPNGNSAGSSSDLKSYTLPYRCKGGSGVLHTGQGSVSASFGRGPKRHGYNENSGNASLSGPSTRDTDATEKPKRKVDCPIHKHHLMHGTQPPCSGCSASHMSQIRHHLDPDRSQRHGQFPSFLKRCQQCKEDVIDRQSWPYHGMNQCPRREQPRGDLITRWSRLYRGLYPDAQRVPIPYVDVMGWQPIDDSQDPFLGGTTRPEQQMTNVGNPLSPEAAFRVMLHHAHIFYRSLLDEAARTIPPEPRRLLAHEIVEEHRIQLEILQRGSQNQSASPHTNATAPEDSFQQQGNLPYSPVYAQNADSHALAGVVHNPPLSFVSTESSSVDYGTGFSQPHRSSMTGASSMPETQELAESHQYPPRSSHFQRFASPLTLGPIPSFHEQIEDPQCPPGSGEQMVEDLRSLITDRPFDGQSPSFNDFSFNDDVTDPWYQDTHFH